MRAQAAATPFVLLATLCGCVALLPGCAGPQVQQESTAQASSASEATPAGRADRRAASGGLEDPWVAAQQPKEARKLVIRPPITPPAVKPTRALDLPPRERAQLPNGMGIVLVPDAQLPLVTVTLLLATGSIDDPTSKVGLAEFTTGMLRQGQKSRRRQPRRQRFPRLDLRRPGGHLSARL